MAFEIEDVDDAVPNGLALVGLADGDRLGFSALGKLGHYPGDKRVAMLGQITLTPSMAQFRAESELSKPQKHKTRQ